MRELLLLIILASVALAAPAACADEATNEEFIQGAFSRFVSPKIVDQLVADPSKLSIEGERRTMTFMFTDIAGFTSLSETIPSKQLAEILNAYLNAVYSLTDPTPMGTVAICHGVDIDSGPSELPDPSGHPRFYVQTSFYLSPA